MIPTVSEEGADELTKRMFGGTELLGLRRGGLPNVQLSSNTALPQDGAGSLVFSCGIILYLQYEHTSVYHPGILSLNLTWSAATVTR